MSIIVPFLANQASRVVEPTSNADAVTDPDILTASIDEVSARHAGRAGVCIIAEGAVCWTIFASAINFEVEGSTQLAEVLRFTDDTIFHAQASRADSPALYLNDVVTGYTQIAFILVKTDFAIGHTRQIAALPSRLFDIEAVHALVTLQF